jgi:hypothetical protein
MSAYAFNDDSAGDQLAHYLSHHEFTQPDCAFFGRLEDRLGPAEATLSVSGVGAFGSDDLFETAHASARARLQPQSATCILQAVVPGRTHSVEDSYAHLESSGVGATPEVDVSKSLSSFSDPQVLNGTAAVQTSTDLECCDLLPESIEERFDISEFQAKQRHIGDATFSEKRQSSWLKLSRRQKAVEFRVRRRQLNLKLFGTTKPARNTIKNVNRQFAATNRKRNAEGKFMDSVHRSRFERRFARHAIFQITKVPRLKSPSKPCEPEKLEWQPTFDIDLSLNEVWGVSVPSFRDLTDDYDCASLTVPAQFLQFPSIRRVTDFDNCNYEPLSLRNHCSID